LDPNLVDLSSNFLDGFCAFFACVHSGKINVIVEVDEVIDSVNDTRGRPNGVYAIRMCHFEPSNNCSWIATTNNEDLSVSIFFLNAGDEGINIFNGLIDAKVLEIVIRPTTLSICERLGITEVSMLKSK